VPRPSRVLAVSGGLAVAGVLIGGTVAYAAVAAQSVEDTYFACVNLATGAMRLVDPVIGQVCVSDPGPGQERQIEWSKSGSRGPEGPAGSRGPRGEPGADGGDSDGGGIGRLEDLAGLKCGSGNDVGHVEIKISAPRYGSAIQLICMTQDTAPGLPPTTRPAPVPMTTIPTEPPPNEHEDLPPAEDAGGGRDDSAPPHGGGNGDGTADEEADPPVPGFPEQPPGETIGDVVDGTVGSLPPS
jgi:hypothetical protein